MPKNAGKHGSIYMLVVPQHTRTATNLARTCQHAELYVQGQQCSCIMRNLHWYSISPSTATNSMGPNMNRHRYTHQFLLRPNHTPLLTLTNSCTSCVLPRMHNRPCQGRSCCQWSHCQCSCPAPLQMLRRQHPGLQECFPVLFPSRLRQH